MKKKKNIHRHINKQAAQCKGLSHCDGYKERKRYKIINKCALLHWELLSGRWGVKARI